MSASGRLATLPTAPIAAGGLIAGFGVALASGSRPAGGAVLAAAGLTCMAAWRTRDSTPTTVGLTACGLVAFALSHVLGHAIGAWPAVFVVSGATAAACWRFSDVHRPRAAAARPRGAHSRPALVWTRRLWPQRNKLSR